MPRTNSTVVTLRVAAELHRRIEREARRRRRTKGAVVRDALEAAFGAGPPPPDPAREARRQSLLVSGRASERHALEFIEATGTARAGDEAGRDRRRGRARRLHREAAACAGVQSDLFNPTHANVTVCPIASDCVDAPLFRLTLPPGSRTDLETSHRSWSTKIVIVPRGAVRGEIGECG